MNLERLFEEVLREADYSQLGNEKSESMKKCQRLIEYAEERVREAQEIYNELKNSVNIENFYDIHDKQSFEEVLRILNEQKNYAGSWITFFIKS